jgi:hypothetical protein
MLVSILFKSTTSEDDCLLFRHSPSREVPSTNGRGGGVTWVLVVGFLLARKAFTLATFTRTISQNIIKGK